MKLKKEMREIKWKTNGMGEMRRDKEKSMMKRRDERDLIDRNQKEKWDTRNAIRSLLKK